MEGSVEHDRALDETLPSNARLDTVAPSATEEEETKEKVEEVGEVGELLHGGLEGHHFRPLRPRHCLKFLHFHFHLQNTVRIMHSILRGL